MTIYENENSADLMDDIHKRLEGAKAKAKRLFYSVLDFAVEHPVEFGSAVSLAMFGIRRIDKAVDIRRAEKLRNSMIYDRSMGMYWETKRPLTANQRLAIEARHKAGEPYGRILSDMKVLKR